MSESGSDSGPDSGAALRLENLERCFVQGGVELPILRGASLTLMPGEIIALTGPSGAGKSTLLHIAGLLEKPDAGEVIVNGQKCSHLNDLERTSLRRSELGFVYQFHHLLPEFTALENIVLPQMIAGVAKAAARDRAKTLLGLVGLDKRAGHRPAELSGGEQQRVAIARALANNPRILLADEPTGNLDEQTAARVFEFLQQAVESSGVAALIATHNIDLAARMDRRVRLHEGVLEAV
ncbi:MAG: ABC transporter ATP-binding protein [Proteobacteria bacterium]|nr:ABC transporter ATP-binding protein [Pseudomonadota bacterium]